MRLLRDSAPPDLSADMTLVINWLLAGIDANNLDVFNVPPDVQAASNRLEPAINARCP